MGLLFAAAVILLIAALVLRSAHPKRALSVAALGLLGLVGGIVLFLTEHESPAPAAIPVEQLALTDVALTSDHYGHQLSGRIANRSSKRVGTVTLEVTFKECPADGACRVLAQETLRLFLALPKGQTGRFSALLAKGEAADRPGVSWESRIAAAEADF